MGINLFVNLGGFGGYQVLTESLITGLRKVLHEQGASFDQYVNLLPMARQETRDPRLARSVLSSAELPNGLHDTSIGILTADMSLRFHGKKRILYPMYEGSIVSSRMQKMLNCVDEIWVPCQHMYDTFENHNVDKNKLKLFHGFIDTDEYQPNLNLKNMHKTLARATGIAPVSPQDPITFLLVGKYENRKASKEVIEAFLKTFENHGLRDCVQLKAKWGTSVYSRSLRQIKEELIPLLSSYPKASQRISLIDAHEVNMVDLYNNADCVLFPSKAEGIGLPALEAMSCATPVITTAYTSLADYVNNEACIILPDEGQEPINDSFYGMSSKQYGTWGKVSVDGIADGMQQFLEKSPKERLEMGKAGRRHMVKHFDHALAASKLINNCGV